MSSEIRSSRRKLLKTAGAVASALILPAPVRYAMAAEPIKIGIPCALTGPFGHLGQQTKRAADLYAKELNAKGGVNGRMMEIMAEDTQGNPAVCVRKVQEFVERRDCRIFTGLSVSPESLAVSPRLGEWNAIHVCSGAGDGRLTAEALVPNFFRSNASSPMGARVVSRYINEEPSIKKIFAIGQDYAWGHNSVQVLETEVKRGPKKFVGKIFTPTGTKDFSPYIAKIRESGADTLYIVLTGDDNNAFVTQAAQYRLPDHMALLMEFIELVMVRAVGDAAVGLTGSSRWPFTYDNPKSKHFTEAYFKSYGLYPDLHAGEQYQALDFIVAAIKKTNSTDPEKMRVALEGMEIDSLKGKVTMRKCDHQATALGYLVKCAKKAGYPHPVPEIITTYPGDYVAPKCNSQTYDS